jgi:hypothetical protein
MVRRLPCVGFLGIQALAVSLGLRLVWRFNSKRGVAQGAGRGRSVRSKREMRPAAGSPQRRISGTRAIVSAILRRRQPHRDFGRTPSADKMRMKA